MELFVCCAFLVLNTVEIVIMHMAVPIFFNAVQNLCIIRPVRKAIILLIHAIYSNLNNLAILHIPIVSKFSYIYYQ